jgi:hypothetical protein
MAEPPSVPTTSEGEGEDPFVSLSEALLERHLQRLTFPQIRRGLEALSAIYVEERARLRRGAALDGAGKRAAFALYYGASHFLAVRAVARSLACKQQPAQRIVDLGCGTGMAGSAIALELGGQPTLHGVDENAWAVEETRWTWRQLGLLGEARVGDAVRAAEGGRGSFLVVAYTVNEIDVKAREHLRVRLLRAAQSGARVLIVEPMALRPLPWWKSWAASFNAAGGRADAWRFALSLPPRLALLGKAAGLKHQDGKARSLYIEA